MNFHVAARLKRFFSNIICVMRAELRVAMISFNFGDLCFTKVPIYIYIYIYIYLFFILIRIRMHLKLYAIFKTIIWNFMQFLLMKIFSLLYNKDAFS